LESLSQSTLQNVDFTLKKKHRITLLLDLVILEDYYFIAMGKFQKITTCLWYDNQANEAAAFYCSLFPNSRVTSSSAMIVEFELEGTKFMAMNGGPKYQLSEASSLFVLCDDQEEVDRLWEILTSDGGEESRCGWCKDKFGLSWQIIPKRFTEMIQTGTSEQKQRVFQAMMPMNKLIVDEFEKAFNQ